MGPHRSSGCFLVVIAPRSNAVKAGCSVRLELPLPAVVERQAIDDEAKHAVTHFKRVSPRRHVPDLKRHVQATCPQRAAPAAQMALAHGPNADLVRKCAPHSLRKDGTVRRRQRPSSVRPGWSSGRRPSGQWNLRSSALMGLSLMLAWRSVIRPFSSNSQFSLPWLRNQLPASSCHS